MSELKRPNPLFRNLTSKLAASPMIFIVLVVFVGSTMWTVASSFTGIKTLPIFTPQEFYDNWVGWGQYVRLWNTPRWIISITNLAIYGLLYSGFAFVIGFLLAVLMDQKIRAESFWRTMYMYPLAVSFIVTGTVWQWLYNPTAGIQFLVNSLGWTDFEFALTTDRKNAIWAIIITGVWQSAGFTMALFLAGLRSVDGDIIKAASIDGASTFRIYRKVILPSITPIFLAVAVVQLQAAIKTFDLAVALTNSGPGISTTFPATYVYDLMFQRGEIGEGAAAAMMILAALAVVLVPYSLYLTWRRRKESGRG